MTPAIASLNLDAVFHWTWTTSVQASVLILFVCLVRALFGRWMRARWLYLLGLLVVARLVLPFSPESRFSIFNLANRIPARPAWTPQEIHASSDPGDFLASSPQSDSIRGGLESARKSSTHAEPDAPPSQTTELDQAAESEQRSDVPSGPDARPLSATASLHSAAQAGLNSTPSESDPRLWVALAFESWAPWIWLAGVMTVLTSVLWQQRRFRALTMCLRPITDPVLHTLLDQCKKEMGVRQTVPVSLCPGFPTPALFGFRKPQLLLPSEVLERLDLQEIRLVLLHELAHVRRRDILLNWVLVLVRALHWFNPLVWLALRQLRADRELVCDEMVLAKIHSEERNRYGHTLLKLLTNDTRLGLSPSLAPVINHKKEIHRRVTMIANYKPANRAAALIFAPLAAAAALFTFTRAADANNDRSQTLLAQDKAPAATLAGTPATKMAPAQETSNRGIRDLENQIKEQSIKMHAAQEKMNVLRQELSVVDAQMEVLSPELRESLRQMNHDRITAEAEAARYRTLLSALGRGPADELRRILPTAHHDTLLTDLLSRYSIAKADRTVLANEVGPEHAKFKSLEALISDLDQQIDRRVDGIIKGLEALVTTYSARAEYLGKEFELAKKRGYEAYQKSLPYLQAKRDFETQQRIHETLQLRLLQERVDAVAPKSHPFEVRLMPAASPITASDSGGAQPPARNVKMPVPLTRELISFAPADPTQPGDVDKFLVLNAQGQPQQVAQADKIVVNLAGEGAVRMAVARISLVSEAKDFLHQLNVHRERLLETASAVISGKRLEETQRPGNRNILRGELLMLFNQALGATLVQDVIISEFVVQ